MMTRTMHKGLFSLLLTVGLIWPISTMAQQICRSESEVPSSTPTSRFTDHGNGTVTDGSSGLMWAKCAAGLSGALCDQDNVTLVSWQGALDLAASSSLAGHDDWRLPNVKELLSIVEQRCWGPAINQDAAVFPNTPASGFWSSSPSADEPYGAWVVFFSSGSANGNFRDSSRHVRLVRSGQ